MRCPASSPILLRQLLECLGPSSAVLDEFIDLVHQTRCFSKNTDDLSVMDYVLVGENSAFAVFEPLLGRAVAADGEIPDIWFYFLKELTTVDKHTANPAIRI